MQRIWTLGSRLALMGLLLLLVSGAVLQEDRAPKPLSFEDPLGEGPVFIIPIEGTIDNPLSNFLDRALTRAEEEEASLVILHMDTYGGLVMAADKMRARLLDTEVPTVTFIDQNAASAGALLSYATDRIVMVPGASIGAATVVEGGTGEAAPDKYQSYMRSQMRSTAQATGRDPDIAEAMVDENLEVEDVSLAGQVLTLSAQEAHDLGVADVILDELEEVVEAFDVADREIVHQEESLAERALRFFASPVVQSILMLLMLGGLYFELQSPGVGIAGAVAAIGMTFFFLPGYIFGLVHGWEFFVFLLGIVLIILELFVFPGFGVPGITGLLAILVALGVSMIGNVGFDFPAGGQIARAINTLAVTLVLTVVAAVAAGRYLPRTERFSQLVLKPDMSSATGYTSADTDATLVGKAGRTLTPLRPSGTAEIEGRRVDVITAGGYIDVGAEVEVVAVRGSRVEVREARAAEPEQRPE